MKTMHSLSCFTLVAMVLLAAGCQDRVLETYKVSTPVYMTYDQLRSEILDTTPREMSFPGKIYFKDNYIFVNEVRKGIHVVDNTNPSAPVIRKFIKIPGNVDMAIKDNILYVDSYIDLVALDISDLNKVKEVKRFRDMFNYSVPPLLENTRQGEVDPSRGVVVGWKEKEVTVETVNPSWFPVLWGWRGGFEDLAMVNAPAGQSSTGVGGSMARFIIYKDILYTIDISTLYLFDLANSLDPVGLGKQGIGWNIETVFVARDHLFIGSMNGMHIYSLLNPVQPQFVSMYWHRTSCDPVVVQGDFAYVTLRTGTVCPTDVNQLDVLDIKEIKNPTLLKSYPMHNPHGLGIDDNILFICDGEEGLKIFDAADPLTITSHQLAHFKNINTYDVIPLGNILLMIGKDGLYQYDYTNLADIKLLSKLSFSRN